MHHLRKGKRPPIFKVRAVGLRIIIIVYLSMIYLYADYLWESSDSNFCYWIDLNLALGIFHMRFLRNGYEGMCLDAPSVKGETPAICLCVVSRKVLKYLLPEYDLCVRRLCVGHFRLDLLLLK